MVVRAVHYLQTLTCMDQGIKHKKNCHMLFREPSSCSPIFQFPNCSSHWPQCKMVECAPSGALGPGVGWIDANPLLGGASLLSWRRLSGHAPL